MGYLLLNALLVLLCMGFGAAIGEEVGPETFFWGMVGIICIDVFFYLLTPPKR